MERLTFKERIQNGQTIFLTFAIVITSLLLLSRTNAIFGEFGTKVLTMALIYSIGGLSVNLITGYCGQLSLGQAGFFAIGAYTTAIFTKFLASTGLPSGVVIVLGIILAAIVTGFFGFLVGIPTLRLSGDYLAIVTLGFAEIIRIVIRNMQWLTGGGNGLRGIVKFSNDRFLGTHYRFMWVLVVFCIVAFILMMFVKSGSGRRTIAVREDEIAANAMGINVKNSKQTAFVLAAAIAGIGGALFAHTQGYIEPGSFQFQMSVDFLIIAVFGGLGSFSGSIIAGLILNSINVGIIPSIKTLHPALMEVDKWRLPIYALILIIVMVYQPGGLLGKKEWSITNFWNNVFGIDKSAIKEADSKENGGVA